MGQSQKFQGVPFSHKQGEETMSDEALKTLVKTVVELRDEKL